MSTQILEKDTDTEFPHFLVLKASAGSGKTYTLTQRYVQFILSDKIPKNRLKNILAITFSNNAAQEMKGRILKWLKSIYLNKTDDAGNIFQIVSLDKDRLIEKAGRLMEEILDNYSDFQVRTIDSFMTTVFKASAIDFGYNPDFDILLNKESVMEYSFNTFLKDVREGTEKAGLLEMIISKIQEYRGTDSSYLWDPSDNLFREICKVYSRLSSVGKTPVINDSSKELATIKQRICDLVESIEEKINESGLERRGNSSFNDILSLARDGVFNDIMKKGLLNPPVKKPVKSASSLHKAFEEIDRLWKELARLREDFALFYCRSFYSSYLKVYKKFADTIEDIKRKQDKVFIEDINRYLSEYLNEEIVPDVYFRIGETIYHFLIDEFQDTSPIQWRDLLPLVENSLSQGGSLLVVGDTKQAIYGFRGADYRIMKKLETENPFPSARHILKELDINYRSLLKILDFNEKVFKRNVSKDEKYRDAGAMSGLTDFQQKVKEGNEGSGYVGVVLCEKNERVSIEKEKLQALVCKLYDRGYTYKDIAILTHENDDVVKISTWLNEKGIPFISYSSLDIRKRKVTGEIVSLLKFLDSPGDNLPFATFILGDIFNGVLKRDLSGVDRKTLREFLLTYKGEEFLYKAFQKEFQEIWEKYFARLFKSAGYLPLYDLVTEVFNVFRIFDIEGGEQATLIKILDVIKDLEGEGYNNLKEFIEFATDDSGSESEWNISIPKENAVSVMTIHKAKGLGFPVVIILLYEDRRRGFDYIVKEDEKAVHLLKINRDISRCNKELELLYGTEKTGEMVNRLNSLYVGFTRAEEELYLIGVRDERRKDKFPFEVLPVEEFSPSEKPERRTVARTESSDFLFVNHQYKTIEFKDKSDEVIRIEEKQRGEFVHRVLSYIEYTGGNFEEKLIDIIRKVKDVTGSGYHENHAAKIIKGIISHDEISDFFILKPERIIKTEQEFSDGQGKLHRMDRLIIDKDRVTVIDYKTGDKEEEEKYIAQLKGYMKILRDVFPDKKIKGIIAYVDLREVKSIN
ncbi:MAG: UvrD-helicase domain-containing protein [Nitrospirae bacterium]|nr:UvrD-helicase domain-containing protein [Nitrospirota bacterium]